MSPHGFRHDRELADIIFPCFRITEHFRRVDITDDMIQIIPEYDDLADTAFYEAIHQFIDRCLVWNGYDFGSRHHAVADFHIREVKRILENLDIRIYLFLFILLIDAALDEIV